MTEVTLYVWPSPFLEPHSLAALLLLQLSIPGHFSIEETANPDTSPSGQLPYLRHGAVTVASFAAIAKYISRSKIAGHVDVDAHLDATQRAQCTAWSALVEAQLGDLVAYTFYAIADNYTNFTVPTLSAHMSIPQRYFVPGRLRELHRPRLEAVGLWDVSSFGGDGEGGDGDDEKGVRGVGVGGIAGGGVSGKGGGAKRKKNEGNMKMAFVREKVLETARRPLSLLSALLADRPFIFHDRATTLDILLAAHILLLTSPTLSSLSSQTNPQNLTLPCTPIHALISDSFPTLEAHARRVYDTCFPHGYAAAGLTKGKDEGRVGWNYDGEEGLSGVLKSLVSPLRARSQSARTTGSGSQSADGVGQPASSSFSSSSSSTSPPSNENAKEDENENEKAQREEERRYSRMRYAWYALAGAAVVGWAAYMYYRAGVRVVWVRAENLEGVGEGEEEKEGEEGEEGEVEEGIDEVEEEGGEEVAEEDEE